MSHMFGVAITGFAFAQIVKAAITPDYHSLIWKHGEANFYAPLGLNTTTFALESPAGAAPDALSRRSSSGNSGPTYLPCTIVTLDDQLSASSLNALLDQYRDLEDDVWSEEQVSTNQCNWIVQF